MGTSYDDYQEIYLNDFKADSRARDYLGLSDDVARDGMVDFTRTNFYDADGKQVRQTSTYGNTDAQGNGRTVTLSDGDDGRSWLYSDVSNDGKDFKRQTVWEGSDLSFYEERQDNGNGEFSELSETRRGDEVLNNSSTSRREITPEYLGLALRAGRLTPEQASAIQAGGEPYYLEQTSTFAKRLEEDGELVTTEVDGKDVPVETGSSSTSYSYSAAGGFEVAEYQQSLTDEEGRDHSSTLGIVTDPDGKVPVRGRVETVEPGPTGAGPNVVRSRITIDNLGQARIDGQPAGEFEGLGPGGVPLEDYLKDPSVSAEALLQGVYKTTKGASGVPGNVARFLTKDRFDGAGTSYGKLASRVNIFGFAYGIEEAISGALDHDLKRSLTGVGFTAGSVNAVAKALSALPDGTLSGGAGRRRWRPAVRPCSEKRWGR